MNDSKTVGASHASPGMPADARVLAHASIQLSAPGAPESFRGFGCAEVRRWSRARRATYHHIAEHDRIHFGSQKAVERFAGFANHRLVLVKGRVEQNRHGSLA